MNTQTLGLDIGGANLKAAHSDGPARSVPFALWKHPEKLPAELSKLSRTMPAFQRVAITMTGELCDCFATPSDGVRALLNAVKICYEELPIRVWSTKGRFVEFEQAMAEPMTVAAANWLALAHFVARQFANENVLLIDTGSTTTDIIYLMKGQPSPGGRTDAVRMISGELVYTGVRRTPICAVLGTDVAAEFFATMLDAYICTGRWRENEADCDTADGRPATRSCSHARLARMRCTDPHLFSDQEALALAERALNVQWQSVTCAIERVLAGKPALERVVVSGSGEIVGRSVCGRQRAWSVLPVTSLAEMQGPERSEAACAYAVAKLASEE